MDRRFRAADRSGSTNALIWGIHRQCVQDSRASSTPFPAILLQQNTANHSASRYVTSVGNCENAVVGRDLTRSTREFEFELAAVCDDNRCVIDDADGEIGVGPAKIDGSDALAVVFVLGSDDILTVSDLQLGGGSHRCFCCSLRVMTLHADARVIRRGIYFREGGSLSKTDTLRQCRRYRYSFICKCDSACMPTIAEFTIPTEQFALRETLDRRPDLTFEVDRVVARATAQVMPFVWYQARTTN